ncbi:hypothetical protein [Phenylobacterium sp.]|jgi:hypothetical protein|uniref:hypothetical protein n=1 Tax=Phenylobacterium sp. TaxID=1871053 RepID=UPI002F94098B
MPTAGAFDALKPFVWLAAIAFLVGFVSYLAFGHPAQAVAQDAAGYSPAVSGEASWPTSEEWNVPKHI